MHPPLCKHPRRWDKVTHVCFMACCVWVGDGDLRKALHPGEQWGHRALRSLGFIWCPKDCSALTRNGPVHSTLPQSSISLFFWDSFPNGVWNRVLCQASSQQTSQQWDILPLRPCGVRGSWMGMKTSISHQLGAVMRRGWSLSSRN